MRRNPYTLLVCILFLVLCQAAVASQYSDTSIPVVIYPGTVMADPASGHPGPLQSLGADEAPDPIFAPASARRGRAWRTGGSSAGPITKCKAPAPACPVGAICAPKPDPPCIVPRRMAGQWEFGVQGFFARVGGTVQSPAQLFGLPADEIDFDAGFGLPVHEDLWEYSGRYQFRPNWAVFYSIMPIHLDANYMVQQTFYLGNWVYPAGTMIRTNFDFIYQRVGLLYQPIVSCNATVSIYSGWLFNDNRLSVAGSGCGGGTCTTVDRTRNMVFSGIQIEKCIRTMCNGGTLNCDSRVDLGYLDNTFVTDVQAGLRYSVPMNCGRWGYAKGGFRYLNFQEDRNDLRFDTVMQGWFGELGLVF
jgi:hypothetical protein